MDLLENAFMTGFAEGLEKVAGGKMSALLGKVKGAVKGAGKWYTKGLKGEGIATAARERKAAGKETKADIFSKGEGAPQAASKKEATKRLMARLGRTGAAYGGTAAAAGGGIAALRAALKKKED
jgi:hypothetical protein